MDFDQAVVGIASQPFWLFWVADGKVRSHAPDYFARRVAATGALPDLTVSYSALALGLT